MKKKMLIILTGMVIMLGFHPSASAASDIDNHWAKEYIVYLDEEGVINPSVSTGNYEPERKVTRAEFMRYINRAFHFTEKATITFDDVPENSWYYEPVQIATRYGYISGIDENTMAPMDEINREQVATILGRLMKADPGKVAPSSLPFKDVSNISEWSAGYIKNALDAEIFSGYNDGTFQPHKAITRGEVAKILCGFMGTSFSKTGKYYTSSDLKSDLQNATISESCMVSGVTIKGDLYITEGLDSDAVTLSNVTVDGRLIVSGGTVLLSNTKVKRMVVSSPMGRQLSVTTSGKCNISLTEVGSPTALYEKSIRMPDYEGFANISTMGIGRVSLTLDAAVNELTLKNEATLSLSSGSNVRRLIVEKPSSITGYGSIYQAEVNANDTAFASSISVTGFKIADGVIVTVGGQDIADSYVPGIYPASIDVRRSMLSSIKNGVNISLPIGTELVSASCDGYDLTLNGAYSETYEGICLSAGWLGMLSAGEHTLMLTLSNGGTGNISISVTY